MDAMARVAGVSIDSRTVRRGELFVAISGPRHDGHDYVADVMESGAVAAVVAGPVVSRYPGWLQDRCITVPDTLDALHNLAQAVRKEWGKKICGITGSVGKTTTKEILAALLGTKLRVLKSEGNFNNEYGLPLTIFRLEPSTTWRCSKWACRFRANSNGWRRLLCRTWRLKRAWRPRI